MPFVDTVEVQGQQEQMLINSKAELKLIDLHLVEEIKHPEDALPVDPRPPTLYCNSEVVLVCSQ